MRILLDNHQTALLQALIQRAPLALAAKKKHKKKQKKLKGKGKGKGKKGGAAAAEAGGANPVTSVRQLLKVMESEGNERGGEGRVSL